MSTASSHGEPESEIEVAPESPETSECPETMVRPVLSSLYIFGIEQIVPVDEYCQAESLPYVSIPAQRCVHEMI